MAGPPVSFGREIAQFRPSKRFAMLCCHSRRFRPVYFKTRLYWKPMFRSICHATRYSKHGGCWSCCAVSCAHTEGPGVWFHGISDTTKECVVVHLLHLPYVAQMVRSDRRGTTARNSTDRKGRTHHRQVGWGNYTHWDLSWSWSCQSQHIDGSLLCRGGPGLWWQDHREQQWPVTRWSTATPVTSDGEEAVLTRSSTTTRLCA